MLGLPTRRCAAAGRSAPDWNVATPAARRKAMSFKHVNAVVIGSARGGVWPKELAEAGLDVVVLERGRWVTPDEERKTT